MTSAVFERIQRILSSRQDWRGLARAYRRMIKRLGAGPLPKPAGLAAGLVASPGRPLPALPARRPVRGGRV